MALPPGITPKTVTVGIASFFDGSLAEGTATITAPVNVVHTPTNRPIFSSQMSHRFVDGETSFNLAPTDAAGLNRVDWTYKLNVIISGALVQPEPVYFTLPVAGPDAIDLDSLVTVPSSAGIPVSVTTVTSVNGQTGDVTVAASTPEAASTTVAGIVELATTGETTTGTDSTRAATPAGVKAVVDGLPVPAAHRARTLVAKMSAFDASTASISAGSFAVTPVVMPRIVNVQGLFVGANGAITIPPGAGGTYLANWNVRLSGGTSGNRATMLLVNGVTVTETGATAATQRPNASEVLTLAAGDVVSLAVYHESGSGVVVTSGSDKDTNLTLARLRPATVKPILAGNSGSTSAGAVKKIHGDWFTPHATWTQMTSTAPLQVPDLANYVAANPDGALDEGIPLIPHSQAAANWNGLLDEVIAGTRDSVFTTLGGTLATYGPKTVFARPWWEFNLANSELLDPAKFKAAWARAIPLLRSGFAAAARPGQTLRITYCAVEARQPDMDTYWPGDAFVDVVGPDVYADIWGTTTPTVAALLAEVRARLDRTAAFAARHGKPVALPEWGNISTDSNGTLGSQGRGDCPEVIDAVFDWADQQQALFLIYYNVEANVGQTLAETPLSRARYIERAALAASGLEA